ncbi:MAG TPA: crotonase/enoyl-CoA hydratase family protein [Candidatus Binataceae bacterium]|nr:crotonase/enoyl-CoA hydratase family protein [Candidatus Binataceae bacterium]
MKSIVNYEVQDLIATITMDDGKVNVMSVAMLSALNDALDRAAADHAVVVLTGRPGVFSAGFDLPVLAAGGPDAHKMVKMGFETAARILSFPAPVVVACTGHAIAMGVFLVLAADYRLGADGPFRIGANEVAIGITMPHFAIEICRQRLTPAHFNRAVTFSEMFNPADAVPAGFLDRMVPPLELHDEANKVAAALTKLNMSVHAAAKLRARGQTLRAIRAAIEADDDDWSTPEA